MLRCFWRSQRMRSLFCPSWVSLGACVFPQMQCRAYGPKYNVVGLEEILGTKLETDWEAAGFAGYVFLHQLMQRHVVDERSGFLKVETQESAVSRATPSNATCNLYLTPLTRGVDKLAVRHCPNKRSLLATVSAPR
ncbi:unnamed protein product [Effrenium voratum]|nr:unnamed protein product [Effrenium voratum]